jgi:hypothetical protein
VKRGDEGDGDTTGRHGGTTAGWQWRCWEVKSLERDVGISPAAAVSWEDGPGIKDPPTI